MKLCGHTLWDHTDPNQMIDGMKVFADYYAVPLSKQNFSIEKAKMEFRNLKRFANRYLYALFFLCFIGLIDQSTILSFKIQTRSQRPTNTNQ